MDQRTATSLLGFAWGLAILPSVSGASLHLGTAAGRRGELVVVAARLAVEPGTLVAGTQNDIRFPAGISIVARANGRPDCIVNPAIDKAATSFGFLPSGCAGTTCEAVRAIVLSTENSDPLPFDAVLYECRIQISSEATPGTKELSVTGLILGDPSGARIPAGMPTSGTVTVEADPSNVFCAPPRPAPPGPAVYGEDQILPDPGEVVFQVRLATGGEVVGGVQNDLGFGAGVRVLPHANGRPDCLVNPTIDKGATRFAFLPPGCVGLACTGMRALVVSTDNVAPIADGVALYSCRADLSGVLGEVPVSQVIFADPLGNEIAGSGREGRLCVEPPPPSPTSSPTAEATGTSVPAPPSPTPSPVVTGTSTPSWTPTVRPPDPSATPTIRPTGLSSPTASPTSTTIGTPVEQGCQIARSSPGFAGWGSVLLPAILWARRRSRGAAGQPAGLPSEHPQGGGGS